MTNQKSIGACCTEPELVHGKNGKALFNERSRLPEELEDCSRADIARAYRIERNY